jgi:uncharacterized protein (DUF736 family)
VTPRPYPSRAPFDFAQDEQRAAPLRIHNRQKTAEGNVQRRWEAGGSQTRPYVAVKSAQPRLAAPYSQVIKEAAHLKVVPNEQRAAPLRIHNRQKTAEGNVQGRWEASGSQSRPYVAVKSAQPGLAAPCARVIKVAAHLKVAPTL